ncbi:MAG TPA: hypothetical protein VGH63_10455 [Polyangia bacterium]
MNLVRPLIPIVVILAAAASIAAAQEPPPVAADEMSALPPSLEPEGVGPSGPSPASAIPRHALLPPLGLEVQLWAERIYDRVDPTRPYDTGVASDYAALVVDFRHDWRIHKAWRIAVSDRLYGAAPFDRAPNAPPYTSLLNNIRELSIGWHGGTTDSIYIDVGRINVRNGVASGYNPTDFFKVGAVRTAISLDPSALQIDRLGTVMGMLHYINAAGAWTLAIVPPLNFWTDTNDAWYSPALSRTNYTTALFAKYAPQLSERFSLDLLMFAPIRSDLNPKLGVDASLLLANAWVMNAEWAVDRCTPLAGPGDATPGPIWCHRVAANVVWTTPLGFELTIEGQYSSDALSLSAWRRWRSVSGPALAPLGAIAAQRELEREPLVQAGLFARLDWREPFAARGLHVSAFAQINPFDWSALAQLSIAWRIHDGWLIGQQTAAGVGAVATQFGSTATPLLQIGLYLSKTL